MQALAPNKLTFWFSGGDIVERRAEGHRVISEAQARESQAFFVRAAAECAGAGLDDAEAYYLRREADLRDAIFNAARWSQAGREMAA